MSRLTLLPVGLYSVPEPHTPGKARWWRVSRDRWGTRLEPFPDTYSRPAGNTRRRELDRVTGEIARDPARAAARFATEARRCAHCGTPLTDTRSLAAGLGPRCAPTLPTPWRTAIRDAITRHHPPARPKDTWLRRGTPVIPNPRKATP